MNLNKDFTLSEHSQVRQALVDQRAEVDLVGLEEVGHGGGLALADLALLGLAHGVPLLDGGLLLAGEKRMVGCDELLVG